MKANQKFLKSEEAVSPVIAVILMVAITVVLAATVYVWVSGFGAQTSQPSMSVALTSTSAIQQGYGAGTGDTLKTYTVSTATPGMKWGDLKVTLDGADVAYAATFAADKTNFQVTDTATGNAIADNAIAGSTIKAGQLLKVVYDGSIDGKTLRLIDAQANSVVLTVIVG